MPNCAQCVFIVCSHGIGDENMDTCTYLIYPCLYPYPFCLFYHPFLCLKWNERISFNITIYVVLHWSAAFIDSKNIIQYPSNLSGYHLGYNIHSLPLPLSFSFPSLLDFGSFSVADFSFSFAAASSFSASCKSGIFVIYKIHMRLAYHKIMSCVHALIVNSYRGVRVLWELVSFCRRLCWRFW